MSASTRRPGGPRRHKISSQVNLTDYLINRTIKDDVLERVKKIRERVREQDEETEKTAKEYFTKMKEQDRQLEALQTDLADKKLPAPHVPKLHHVFDTSHFTLPSDDKIPVIPPYIPHAGTADWAADF